MKKLYTLLVVVFATLSSTAQIVNIPDAGFKAWLLAANQQNNIAGYQIIDLNNNGEIEVSEAALITYLELWVGNFQSDDENSTPPFDTINSLEGINAFTNLVFLRCISIMTELNINGLQYLEYLNIDANPFSSLSLTNLPSLKRLFCSDADLELVFQLQLNSLETLYCGGNEFTYNQPLSNINIAGFPNLKYLYIENFSITSINLENLENLTDLEFLNLGSSAPTIILQGLTNLLSLSLYSSQLTSIDLQGVPNLQALSIRGTQLTSIDLQGVPNLQTLECNDNQLTSLDISGLNNLQTLRCQNNQLTNLNVKNGNSAWFSLNFSNNSNLEYICADEQEMSIIQSRIVQYGYTNCNVNSYCSFVPGGTFYTIQGNTRFDTTNNGCDATDINIANQRFTISSGSVSGSLIANQTGAYSIPVQTGTHTVTPNFENPSYFTVSPTTATVTFPAAPSPFTQNFCVRNNGIRNDLEVTVLPIFVARPGFDTQYKIIYKNKGNQVSNGTLSLSFDDNKMDLVTATPINTESTTNSLSWSYSNLNPFESREIDLTFNINSPMETPAVNGGDVLNYTATIVGATDETPNDNTFTLNQTVVNSYDPNDKTCLEGATITPSMVGNYVHYVIRFENTGTFAAQNIVVSDVIDATKFDIATLSPQNSSHTFITRINSTTGKVEFIFENINLPFDDANNDGYVAFKIKTKPTLVLGDTFSNTANIYFDYNFPIVTNTATTTIAALSNQDFDFGSYFSVYPIPAKDVLHLETKNEIGVKAIHIYNTLGQMVLVVTNPENNAAIDVANLKTGTYFIKVITDKGTANTKFIKE